MTEETFNEVSYLKLAVKTNPLDETCWLRYVGALIEAERISEAYAFINKSDTLRFKSKEFIDFRNLVRRKYRVQSKIEPSEEQLGSLIRYFKTGEYEHIIFAINDLFKTYPDSAILSNLLGLVYASLGNVELAISHYENSISKDETFTSVYINLGSVYKANENFEMALKYYGKAIELNPYDRGLLNNLTLLKIDTKDYEGALEVCFRAFALFPNASEVFFNLGTIFSATGKKRAAAETLLRAIKLDPNYLQPRIKLANLYLDTGRVRAAIDQLTLATKLEPDNGYVYNNLGVAYKELGDVVSSKSNYLKAIELQPNNLEFAANLMELFEQSNSLVDLEKLLTHYKTRLKKLPSEIGIFEIILTFRKKDFHVANSLAQNFNFNNLSTNRKIRFLNLKAKISDKLENFDRAFEEFNAFNEFVKSYDGYPDRKGRAFLNQCEKNYQSLKLSKRKRGTLHINREFSKVFLVGFPRSGTTLMDTMLRSHEEIDVLEEKPLLQRMDKIYDGSTQFDFIETFPDEKQRLLARKTYSADLLKYASKPDAKIVIDKLPLNILELPKLNYLFPEAVFIVALRHPLDCILSNWMQHYELNPAMANMLEISRIVEFYCVCMETLFEAENKLGLTMHFIHYEALIMDMKSELSKLLDFLNLDWDDNIFKYQENAKSDRLITTPSYSQVVQSLYQDSVGRWENYVHHLQEHIEKIRPLADKLGYSLLPEG